MGQQILKITIMRWYEPPKPSHKESRTITKFLFFPMTIGSETRWLETATWFEVYWKNVGCGEWVHGGWINND